MTDIRSLLEGAGVHVQPYDENDPAATAIAPGRGSSNPLEGKAMNTNTNITDTTRRAMSADDFAKLRDDLESKVAVLQRQTYILNDLLEDSLDERRGRANGDTITLMFQRRGIDAVQWLSGVVWSDAADLVEMVDALFARLEARS